MFQMQLTMKAADYLHDLHQHGYDVHASDDFEEIEDLVAATGKPRFSPMFDLNRNDFTCGRAFWLFLRKDGDVLAGLAAQSIRLGAESFERYIRRTTARQYGIDVDLRRVAAPLNERLRGDLIYFGDLHVSEGARGRRQVLRPYARLGMVLAAMTWPEFDWMFAHIPYQHRSLQDVYGMSMITHGAFEWGEPRPFLRRDDMAVIYQSKGDLRHSLLF